MSKNLSYKTKSIHLDFEKVEVGRTTIKPIEILNESSEEEIYQVQRDPTTNPLDHVFHLRSYNWVLAPGEKYTCEIRYQPNIVCSRNVDYFAVMNSVENCIMKITVSGSSIGPEVISSSTKMIMCSTKNNLEVKKRIKLTNNSTVTAIFMVDIDERYNIFKVDANHGFIKPCSYKYIMITFTPEDDKSYSYHLPILVLHQEPIIIDLYGYCNLSYKEGISFNSPWKEKAGFKGYMSEGTDTIGELPPISLSKNYFDFGQTDVDLQSSVQRIPHAICLTNHTSYNLVIVWEHDIEGIFTVTPTEMRIQAKQSVLFELLFNPNVKNNLYGREIMAHAFFEHPMSINFPFATWIRMIGHSFPAVSTGWLPQYEIPQTVVMPPTIPSFPVYKTFLIKRFGHLPLMFQFVAPSTSHFTVKPMLGVIYQNYQIITVKMAPELKNEQIYVERWTLYFNGNTKNENSIDFKGYAEYANVMFINNGLTFMPVYPGCQQFEEFGIRNVTRHKIKFVIYQIPPELQMEYESKEIEANDTLIQTCIFEPAESQVNYDFELQCVLVVLINGIAVGAKNCVTLRVQGRSESGLLVAIPRELNFKSLAYGSTKTLSFDLFNFSQVNIYYKLICTHCNWPLGNIEKDVTIYPISETVFPNSHQRITISITPRTPGYYQFFIQYAIRVNYKSEALIDQEPNIVCIVHCMCILPILKVKNICAFGCEQKYPVNMNKPFLWEAMKINKLNALLENMLPGDTKMLTIKLFPMVINAGVFFAQLIVINTSKLSVTWNLQRIHQCGCKPVIKKKGISFEEEVIECIHKNICTLDPKSQTLQPNQTALLTMKANYAHIGKFECLWDLDIEYDRHVILNILIDCLADDEQQYNFLSPTSVQFERIYFGNREETYQVYWIHNVTNNDLPYSVDITDMCELNKAYNWEVFSCSTQGGIVKAYTAKPLLLMFQPRMFGAYKAILPITLGSAKLDLTLEGDSSCDTRSMLIGKSIPTYGVSSISSIPGYLSKHCIDIWSMPTHCSIVKLFFISNNLKSDPIAYEWKCQDVPNIFSVQVLPRKGIIHAATMQSFKVKICSKGQPCNIDINIPFELFNASARRDYQRSIIKYNILCEELKGQFVITEKGVTVPEPWLKILDKPKLFYKTMTVRCSVYSVEDECLRVNLTKELQTKPSSAICFNKSETRNLIMSEKERSIITFILEGLLWDIVSGRRFKKTIKESLIQNRNLYYSQFMMDLSKRNKLIERSNISPPLKHISAILEEMLCILVHEEFSLELTHFIPEDDARHINYIKKLQKQNSYGFTMNFDETYDRHLNSSKYEDVETIFMGSRSRVSFMEDQRE